ncbi:MAG: rhodanese-related sulfurtransferase [Pseudomonadota bacterium]|nr:rhodanese-related sulfurtransferase [Pseudomonadota bacterium]
MSEKQNKKIIVVAMYHFVRLEDFKDLKPSLFKLCCDNSIVGTILLAREGLNGTIAGPKIGVDNLLFYLLSDPRFKNMRYKLSYSRKLPFRRLKVRLKREIVTMGVPNTDPVQITGQRVNAKQWNELLNDPGVITIDTRNKYERDIGTFRNSISPDTETFREFPNFVDNKLDPQKHQKVAMFCTGGIRCEKASNYLIKQGFKEVYQLDGGILRYLETVEKKESLWYGECFVFDDRVSVDEDLSPGSCIQCYACRRPLFKTDLNSPHYVVGVSCHHCYGKHGAKKLAGLRERQRQYELARDRK